MILCYRSRISVKCIVPVFLIILGTECTQCLRLCTPGEDKLAHCRDLQRDLTGESLRIGCIGARDRYECLEFLMKDYVDVVLADPEDAYISQKEFASKLLVLGQTVDRDRSGEPFRYESVAVVRKSRVKTVSDLKGARTCHTGYKKTAGWHIPVSQMIRKKLLPRPCSERFDLSTTEEDFKAISSYFQAGCIPGQWAPDPQTDRELKKKYSRMCSLCSDPARCDGEDRRSGYEGALRCLTETTADVAWTKLSVAEEFFRTAPNVSNEFGYLCRDGSLSFSGKPCFWGGRPWKIWISSAKSNQQSLSENLKFLLGLPIKPYSSSLFGAKKESVFVAMTPKYTTKQYVTHYADYMDTITTEICPTEPVRLCVDSEAAFRKCNAMAVTFESRRIRPGLSCVLNEEDEGCFRLVNSSQADAMMAGSSDLYTGYKNYDLIPLLSERYGLLPLSYYAVALIKADSSIKSLEDLKGKRSCHTGVGRTAGWKIPVATLLEKGLLSPVCDIPMGLANFFSVSCIPGIKDKSFDPQGTVPESLCGLCPRESVSIHDSSTAAYTLVKPKFGPRCTKTENEPFYGYSGAFRCLVEGGGDVAFVKHTTIGDNTNGNSDEPWSKHLHSRDFKLLCPRGEVADPIDFGHCYWGRVPARKLLIRGDLEESRKEDIRILMTSAVDKFPSKQEVISLFGSFQNRKNLIFKDDTTSFDMVDQANPFGEIEEEFFQKMNTLNVCKSKSTTHTLGLSVPLVTGILVLLQKMIS